jgi:hypothetical protein
MFSSLDRAKMGVWEALDSLNELREYEAALMAGSAQVDPDMPLKVRRCGEGTCVWRECGVR